MHLSDGMFTVSDNNAYSANKNYHLFIIIAGGYLFILIFVFFYDAILNYDPDHILNCALKFGLICCVVLQYIC